MRFGKAFGKAVRKALELLVKDFVVILPPGIAGNPAARFASFLPKCIDRSRSGRIVVQGTDDDAAQARDDAWGIAAARVRQVLHLTGVAAGEPLSCQIQLSKRLGARDSAKIKSAGACSLDDPRGFGGAVHGISERKAMKGLCRRKKPKASG